MTSGQQRYFFIDSGSGLKLEQFGPYKLVRPAGQALWRPRLGVEEWSGPDGSFSREGGSRWICRSLPKQWEVEMDGLHFKIAPTDFGHLGVFPEHRLLWRWMEKQIVKGMRVLNLFAYSGGATLAAARSGAEVCHLDASKGMVAWARENAALNGMEQAPIRWIVDDVLKFLKREAKRGSLYEGIILDPPSFGRGSRGEVFKIEEGLNEILSLCSSLLSPEAKFMILSSHTPGMTPIGLGHLLRQVLKGGTIESGELFLAAERGWDLPCGTYARWFR